MVIDMTKYSFILLDKDLNAFLQKIQEWGVMDIKRTYKAIDDTSRDYIERAKRFNNALRDLKNFKTSVGREAEHTEIQAITLEYLEEQLALSHTLHTEKLELQKERITAQVWGDFNNEDLQRLEQLNLNIHFYIVPEKKFDKEWENEYSIQILNKINDKVYFVVVSEKGDEYSFPLSEAKFQKLRLPSSRIRKRLIKLKRHS